MAWETISPKTQSGTTCFGANWKLVPCVSISKTGITFNRHAADLLGITTASIVNVMVDVRARKVAFKIPDAGDEVAVASGWNVRDRNAASATCKSLSLGIGVRLYEPFPDSLGGAYRLARVNERIVEMAIVPSNCIGHRKLAAHSVGRRGRRNAVASPVANSPECDRGAPHSVDTV